MNLSRKQVFTPGSFPTHTYVERKGANLEEELRLAFEGEGMIVSVTGPSKSGKTVLVERVVGKDNLIPVTGAGLNSAEHLWQRILNWMGEPASRSQSDTHEATVEASAKASGGVSLPFVAKAGLELGGSVGGSKGRTNTSNFERRGLVQVVDEIADSDFVILVDDFHYTSRSVQEEIIKEVKEAARQRVKIVLASVPHRGDDPVRANPDVRGRLLKIDLRYWSPSDLRHIAEIGFGLLNASLSIDSIDRFVQEAAGSPQLMQNICLSACQQNKIDIATDTLRTVRLDEPDIRRILEWTARSSSFHDLVSALDSGPKVRGTARIRFRFNDGHDGDVYRCILRSIAADPPKLSFGYQDILNRIRLVCSEDSPVGSAVSGSLNHMHKIATENFPNEDVLDWDAENGVLDIPDPYLIFYLRWSGHLEVEI